MANRQYLTFDTPSSGGYMSYDANISPGVSSTEEGFSFGFASGVEPVFSFSGVNGKLYDGDGNFVYSYSAGKDNLFEIHGNVFNNYHNYSINRVPVNLNCSKAAGNYIDGFFFDNEDFKVGLSARTAVGTVELANYALSFTGDTHIPTRRGDLVATDFNPDDFDLASKGFTISYWVRPDELGADMFCIGRKAHNNERFTFGISRSWKGYFGVGANQSQRGWETMLDTAGIDKATHLTYDASSGKWLLTIGKWYHFAVTYAGTNAGLNNMLRKIYMNGQQIWGTGVSDPTYKGNINWSQTGMSMNKGMSFGMRSVRGSGSSASYNNGWACGLDEVAIYDNEKDASWVANVYNNSASYDHTGASNLVGYWKFNEGSGTIVEDLSGNGNHGLLTNDSHGDDGGAAFASGTPTWEKIVGF